MTRALTHVSRVSPPRDAILDSSGSERWTESGARRCRRRRCSNSEGCRHVQGVQGWAPLTADEVEEHLLRRVVEGEESAAGAAGADEAVELG